MLTHLVPTLTGHHDFQWSPAYYPSLWSGSWWSLRYGSWPRTGRLVSLRGQDYECEQEIEELETALDKEKASFLQVLKSGTEPMLVLFFLVFFQTSSGTDTVSIYSLIIFSDFKISKLLFALMFQVRCLSLIHYIYFTLLISGHDHPWIPSVSFDYAQME